jgi:hypothetical protein
MNIIGTVSGGASYWPWFGVLPSVSEQKTVYGSLLSTVSDSPWLTVSEKERIEQLLLSGSLVIPPPQINIAAFQNIALNFPDFFAISLAASIGGLGAFGIVESAITLAALGAWARSQHYSESDLVQALLAGRDKNPLEVVLKEYINHGKTVGVDALSMQLLLRQLVALQAALKTASSDTVLKAFLLAQQQIVIVLLQKWSEAQAQLAALQREHMVNLDIRNAEITRHILSDYIKTVEGKQEGLKQPVLSIIFGGLFIDSFMIGIITTLIPAASAGGVAVIPATLAVDLGVIAAGVIASTLMWAAPIAMSITAHPPGQSDTQVAKDSAKAFALTMASMVNNTEFEKLLNASLSQAVASGLITKSKAETISATFKASLLLTAMALLYKSDMGGVTAGELRTIITGEITVGENDFLGVLAKLINEQLNTIDPADREKLLEELLAPYDQPLSLEQLVDPLSCFISGWNPQCIRDSALASHG